MVWLVSMTFVQYQRIYKKTKINLFCLCFLCYFTWISEVQVVPFINLYDWFFRKLVSLTSNKITKQWRQVAVGDEWSKTKGNEHSFSCIVFIQLNILWLLSKYNGVIIRVSGEKKEIQRDTNEMHPEDLYLEIRKVNAMFAIKNIISTY